MFKSKKSEYTGVTAEWYHGASSNSDIFIYNDIEWVKGLHFGGVSDWAVDLDRNYGDDEIGEVDEGEIEDCGESCDLSRKFDSLEDLAKAAPDMLDGCPTIHAFFVLQSMLNKAVEKFEDVDNGYDHKFNTYRKAMNNSVPEQLRLWANWNPVGETSYEGDGQKFFDCDFDAGGDTYKGACPVPRSMVRILQGSWDLYMKLQDTNGFDAAVAEMGMSRNWIEFKTYEDELLCWQGPIPGSCMNFFINVTGAPTIKDDFEMPRPQGRHGRGAAQHAAPQDVARGRHH